MTGTMAVILVVLLYRPLFTEETSWREFSVRNIYRAGKNLENIVSGERVTQTFTASSAFDCILVQGYLKNGEVSDGGCQVEIQDETGKTLVSTFPQHSRSQKTSWILVLNPLCRSRRKKRSIRL